MNGVENINATAFAEQRRSNKQSYFGSDKAPSLRKWANETSIANENSGESVSRALQVYCWRDKARARQPSLTRHHHVPMRYRVAEKYDVGLLNDKRTGAGKLRSFTQLCGT
jgi:hypothetical protein